MHTRFRYANRLFWALAGIAFRRQFTYRAATLAGLATNLFFGLLRVAVFTGFYGARPSAAGLTLNDAITFTALGQGLLMFFSLFGWDAVAQSVLSGEIAGDLLKPLDYYLFWLAQDCGRALAQLLLRGVPIVVLYAVWFQLTLPADALQWGALILALGLGWWISFSWRFLINLSAFWTPNATGVLRFAYSIGLLLSGFLAPMQFYPPWLSTLCYLTPLPALFTTPLEIWLNTLRGPALGLALLVQLAWALGLALLAHLTLRAGVRRLTLQGG